MVVGDRQETMLEKNRRHIKEMKEDISGWTDELDYAKKKQDVKYEQFCCEMLEICKNTVEQLENTCKKYL